MINKTLTQTDLEMEEAADIKEVKNGLEETIVKEEIFTKVIRAGKRTYFFDVKATRQDDYYLTITESKKRLGKEGKIFYEKHKIFLYKEDFEKFTDGLKEAISYIENDKHEPVLNKKTYHESESRVINNNNNIITAEEFTNVEFDDLGKK